MSTLLLNHVADINPTAQSYIPSFATPSSAECLADGRRDGRGGLAALGTVGTDHGGGGGGGAGSGGGGSGEASTFGAPLCCDVVTAARFMHGYRHHQYQQQHAPAAMPPASSSSDSPPG